MQKTKPTCLVYLVNLWPGILAGFLFICAKSRDTRCVDVDLCVIYVHVYHPSSGGKDYLGWLLLLVPVARSARSYEGF